MKSEFASTAEYEYIQCVFLDVAAMSMSSYSVSDGCCCYEYEYIQCVQLDVATTRLLIECAYFSFIDHPALDSCTFALDS